MLASQPIKQRRTYAKCHFISSSAALGDADDDDAVTAVVVEAAAAAVVVVVGTRIHVRHLPLPPPPPRHQASNILPQSPSLLARGPGSA